MAPGWLSSGMERCRPGNRPGRSGRAVPGVVAPAEHGSREADRDDRRLRRAAVQRGDQALSLRQLQALPADPAKLKALLLAGWSSRGSVGTATSYLFQTVPAILEMPVTPAVRSALYMLLASLPGVQSGGTVTDITGRQGVAVTYTARYLDCGIQLHLTSSAVSDAPPFSSCTIQQVLIINPDDGMPLAEELRYTQPPAGQHWSAPDGLFSYEVFGTPYWTNHDRPSSPKN
jgi:hypothetical protein